MWAPWPFGGPWHSLTLCPEPLDSGTSGGRHSLAVWPPLNSEKRRLVSVGSGRHPAAAVPCDSGGLQYGVAWSGGDGSLYAGSWGAPCPLEVDWPEQEEVSSGMVATHSGGLNRGGHELAVWSSRFLCEGGQAGSWQHNC